MHRGKGASQRQEETSPLKNHFSHEIFTPMPFYNLLMELSKQMKASEVINILNDIIDDKNFNIDEESPLVGSSTHVDSMTLVQLCIKLEEESLKLNFNFDWTSEKAMSSMNSIFKNCKSIAEEFNSQYQSSFK